MSIHPTAIISSKAKIAEDVKIGPYSIIEDNVCIAAGSTIASHAIIGEFTRMGKNNSIGIGCVIGGTPQDKKFKKNTKSYVSIGDDNVFREYVTIHRSSNPDKSTQIGNGNYLMANVHVGHDCILENDIVIANGTMLGGHCTVYSNAFISGMVAVHQNCRVGSYVMVAGLSRITKDVVPFGIYEGIPLSLYGVNVVALKRAQFDAKRIQEIRSIYRQLFHGKKLFAVTMEELNSSEKKSSDLKLILEFIQSTRRGIVLRN